MVTDAVKLMHPSPTNGSSSTWWWWALPAESGMTINLPGHQWHGTILTLSDYTQSLFGWPTHLDRFQVIEFDVYV